MHSERMPRLILSLVSSLLVLGVASAKDSEIALVNGKDLSALEYVTMPAADISSVAHYNADGSLSVAGKPIGYLATKKSYDNYRLHAEWRWPKNAAKNSNGGILVHIATGPKDRQWPECFQVQLKPTRAGDILPMAGAVFAEKLSTTPGAATPQLDRRADSSEKPLGEWNTGDIYCHDGVVEVTINGVAQNKFTDANPGAGKVGFQLEGTPYELRNVRLTPLD
jgi:hypothetical protein